MSDLESFRQRLDEIDGDLIGLLGERFEVCREVADYKHRHDVAMMQPDRVAQVHERYVTDGAAARLPTDFTEAFFELLIDATCALEDQLMAELAAAAGDSRTP